MGLPLPRATPSHSKNTTLIVYFTLLLFLANFTVKMGMCFTNDNKPISVINIIM